MSDFNLIEFSKEAGLKMFDALSRTASSRQVKPLDQISDYIEYDHRYLYDGFNLMIGDVYMMIPPEFIHVTSESFSQSIQTLRQENSQKQKTGYHKRTVQISLIFNGMDEINGYKVPAPTHKSGKDDNGNDLYSNVYYVDGLRPLLAQFKCTPFLPITNDLLNNAYKIYVVALQAIRIGTIPGFQNALTASLTLQEVDMMPYIEMPNIMYRYTIDWDLFRFYTQSFLTETHEYKKLQSLPVNRDHTAFKLSVLNEECLQIVQTDSNGNKKAVTVKDKKDGTTKEETVLEAVINPENYTCLVNSAESDVHITEFECSYSNILTSIQMSDASSPTLQYLGGQDTLFAIVFETTDVNVVGSIEQCQIMNDLITRNNPKIRGSVGFVKIEADFVTFCGSLFCTIDSVETHTVPGIPGLYQVKLLCVSYDIAQSRREKLEGFLPFDGYESNINDLNKTGYELRKITAINGTQTIEQSYNGLMTKIYQDNYAEKKLRETMEVYPDLRLPTYDEVDEVITNIIAFRRQNNLKTLPYTRYPVQSTNILSGNGVDDYRVDQNNLPNTWLDHGGKNVYKDFPYTDFSMAPQEKAIQIEGEDIIPQEETNEGVIKMVDDGDAFGDSKGNNINSYTGFVDPDFYVFYPNTYLSIYQEEEKEKAEEEQSTGKESSEVQMPERELNGGSTTVTTEHKPTYYNGDDEDSKITGYINCLKEMEGHTYCPLAEGEVKDYNGPMFDEIGLITYTLKRMGVIPVSNKRLSYKDFDTMDIFKEVLKEELKKGDIIVDSTKSNCGTYIGRDSDNNFVIITCLEKQGVSQQALFYSIGHVYRILPLQRNNDTQGTKQSNPYDSGSNNQYPDASRQITPKSPTALETTNGYTSENPYGTEKQEYITKEQMDAARREEYTNQNRSDLAEELAEDTSKPRLDQADITGLYVPEIEDDGSEWSDGSIIFTCESTMTLDEFEGLARSIAGECEGEPLECKMAMAQYFYDVSVRNYNGSGFGAITINNFFSEDKGTIEEQDLNEARQAVKRTFMSGMRWKKDWKVFAFTSMSNANHGDKTRKDQYQSIKSVGQHHFYGINERWDDYICYTVQGTGVGTASSNTIKEEQEIILGVTKATDTHMRFGMPIYIKPRHFDTHDSAVGKEWAQLNNDYDRLMTCFVDDVQYSAKGRMVRAFPTFLFCILDDNNQWFDGRKLWTNYYVYKPVVDINFHAANDMPTSTAQITVTNTYHNLDRSSAALVKYSLSEDMDYLGLNRWLYKYVGMVIGGIKITNRLIQLHSIIYSHTRVREGARVHLRMGYGSDPLSLAPVINGTISGMTLGDRISITVTSDGHELIQTIVSDSEKDINNGFLGLHIGATQEAANIISGILYKRESWINHLFFAGSWYEGSKFNIEHFGLYLNSGGEYAFQGGIDTGIYEQYDMLMNIYNASTLEGWIHSYRHWNCMYNSRHLFYSRDGEENIVFNQYNMTPWDIFQLCAQTMPEFLIKPEMYQFDHRLYFGLPFDLTKYRYDLIAGTVYQECKSNTQVHYIDSITSIIENQVSVTAKYSFTNAKVIYSRGGTATTTAVIHSDDTIDPAKQSTHIIDSSIYQDYFGWDAFWEFFGAKEGKKSARRLGISNLLYGWQKQYQGQLLCLGAPHIKPEDFLMVNDFYTSLNGLCMVREIIHSFNTSTGFTSSIIPGVIGICPEQDSQSIIMIANLLNLYAMFTEYAQNRRVIRDNCERYAEAIASIQMAVNAMNHPSIMYNTEAWGVMSSITSVWKDIEIAMLIFKIIRCIKNAGSLFKAIKAVYQVYKGVQTGITIFKSVKNIITLVSAINYIAKAGEAVEVALVTTGAVSAPETLGIGFAVCLIISIIVDIIFKAIETWVENRNVVALLPLWWEGEPFISGVQGGEKILLIPAGAAEENTGEHGHDDDEYDETTVEDN